MAEQDPRIGFFDENGNVKVWPKTDMNGGSYDHPASKTDIGTGRFVIVPAGFSKWEEIAELKGQSVPPNDSNPLVEGTTQDSTGSEPVTTVVEVPVVTDATPVVSESAPIELPVAEAVVETAEPSEEDARPNRRNRN